VTDATNRSAFELFLHAFSRSPQARLNQKKRDLCKTIRDDITGRFDSRLVVGSAFTNVVNPRGACFPAISLFGTITLRQERIQLVLAIMSLDRAKEGGPFRARESSRNSDSSRRHFDDFDLIPMRIYVARIHDCRFKVD